jgi:hypothetical protein
MPALAETVPEGQRFLVETLELSEGRNRENHISEFNAAGNPQRNQPMPLWSVMRSQR